MVQPSSCAAAILSSRLMHFVAVFLILRVLRSGLLLLFGQTSRHEFVGIEPFVHSSFNAGYMTATQFGRRPTRDTLFVATIRQVVNDLLDQQLLLQRQSSLLEFRHAGVTTTTTSRSHHVAATTKAGRFTVTFKVFGT